MKYTYYVCGTNPSKSTKDNRTRQIYSFTTHYVVVPPSTIIAFKLQY